MSYRRICSLIVSLKDLRLLLEIFLLNALIDFKTRILGSYKIDSVLSTKVGPPSSYSIEKLKSLYGLFLAFKKKIGIPGGCMTDSLLLFCLLRRFGYEANVRFGAAKDDTRLVGHCWVAEVETNMCQYEIIV